jgi:hypothetical protein
VKLFEKVFKASTPEFTETENPSEAPNAQNGEVDAESNTTEPISMSLLGQDDSLLSSSITQCIIQLEAVCALNNMLFGRNAFKIEGPVKKVNSPNLNGDDLNGVSEDMHMFKYMSSAHLMRSVECLIRSHELARQFNTNSTQRTLLWKAAFKGKCKPNLFKQETNSLHCALNILFRLFAQVGTEGEAKEYRDRIVRLVNRAVDYYLEIHAEHHRNAWFSVIQLILNRTNELPDHRFKQLGHTYLNLLPRLIKSEEPQIIRDALSQVIGRAFDVSLNL